MVLCMDIQEIEMLRVLFRSKRYTPKNIKDIYYKVNTDNYKEAEKAAIKQFNIEHKKDYYRDDIIITTAEPERILQP